LKWARYDNTVFFDLLLMENFGKCDGDAW
jgi:hypothetical protein